MFGVDDALIGAVIGGGSSLITNLFNRENVEATNAANAQQAQLNRDFQERMSSTAYQRGMADMKAAGLNPILAYQKGGASSPAGSMATMASFKADNPGTEAVNTAMSFSRNRQELENLKASFENIRADTEKKYSESAKTLADLAVRKEELSPAQTAAIKARLDKDVYESTAGGVARKTGTFAEEANRTVAPIVNNATAALRAATFADRFHFGR